MRPWLRNRYRCARSNHHAVLAQDVRIRAWPVLSADSSRPHAMAVDAKDRIWVGPDRNTIGRPVVR